MAEETLTIAQVLTLLPETPARIAALTVDLRPDQASTAPALDEWSVNDVLAHLRACADVWGGCIERMLAEDQPPLRAVNPRTWIEKTNYPKLAFRSSLRAFTRQRAELTAVLDRRTHDEWLRGAIVTGAGKPLQRSVLSYAQWLVRHERPYIKQIERTVAALRR